MFGFVLLTLSICTHMCTCVCMHVHACVCLCVCCIHMDVSEEVRGQLQVFFSILNFIFIFKGFIFMYVMPVCI